MEKSYKIIEKRGFEFLDGVKIAFVAVMLSIIVSSIVSWTC